jgi:hypothetical protein
MPLNKLFVFNFFLCFPSYHLYVLNKQGVRHVAALSTLPAVVRDTSNVEYLTIRDAAYNDLVQIGSWLVGTSPVYRPWYPVLLAKELMRLQQNYPYGDTLHRMLVADVGGSLAGMTVHKLSFVNDFLGRVCRYRHAV